MSSKLNCLLIDDNKDVRKLLSEMLRVLNVDTITYENPLDFLEGPEHNHNDACMIDVILTDKDMPGMSGIEFLEKLKESGCPISDNHKAVISGSFTMEDIQKIKDLGCVFFEKPCSFRELSGWIRDILDPPLR